MARLILGERLYDLAQAGQGQVDALALVEGGPGVSADPRLAVPLTPRQVHQVQLGLPDISVVTKGKIRPNAEYIRFLTKYIQFIYNPPSKIRPGGTEAQQGYSIA